MYPCQHISMGNILLFVILVYFTGGHLFFQDVFGEMYYSFFYLEKCCRTCYTEKKKVVIV